MFIALRDFVLFRLIILVGLCMSLSSLSTLAHGAEQNIYTAPPVPVEATAKTPALARQAGIDAGQIKSLRALLESLTSESDRARLPAVTPNQADAMMVDFSLSGERTTANGYMANMTGRFNAAQIDALLAQAGLGHTKPRTAPLLVLPLYSPDASSGTSAQLWEDANPWADAWNKAGNLGNGLVPIVLSLGDIDDMSALNAAKAVAGGDAALEGARQIASRNGAPDALIAWAKGTPQTGLEITFQGAGVFNALPPLNIPAGATAFADGVNKVRNAIDDSWKNQGLAGTPVGTGGATVLWGGNDTIVPTPSVQNLPPGWQQGPQPLGTGAAGQGSTVTFIAKYGNLDQWIDIRSRLQGIPGVRSLSLQAVTPNQAQVGMSFSGSFDNLQTILSGRGLHFHQEAGIWILENTPAGNPASP